MYRVSAFVLLLGLAACHTCPDHDKSSLAIENAKGVYDAGRFDQAKSVFKVSLEYCPENYDALIGYGNACREYGTELFATVDLLVRQNKPDTAKKTYEEANQNHGEADRAFRSALVLKPDDLAPRYGLGLLWYQRATSPVDYPHPLDDRVNRRDARDKAIAEFEIIVREHPNLMQARRYLGLALFAAARLEEGRAHLQAYHDYQQAQYNRWLSATAQTDVEKQTKQQELAKIESDISAVREIFSAYRDDLREEREALEKLSSRKPEEEARLKSVVSETLALDLMIRRFQLTNLGAMEMELRDRTRDYLEMFNTGKMDAVQPFLLPPQGKEGPFLLAIRRKLEAGTQFRKVQFRTIAVSGEAGTVGFLCDLSSAKGLAPDSEVTLRWRRVSGSWRIVEHP